MAVRSGVLPDEEGCQKLGFAARLGIQSVPIRSLGQPALTRALSSDAAVSDTLFVELAAQLRLPLVTFDRSLLKKFAEIARRPGSLM
jgi:predicted nucleic acid-binding protein